MTTGVKDPSNSNTIAVTQIPVTGQNLKRQRLRSISRYNILFLV